MGKAAKRKKEAVKVRESAPAPPTVKPLPSWLGHVGTPLAATLVLVFVILKCYALHPQRVDEGIYFYQAERLAHGARLYRDLFFAHPPIHLLFPTVLIAISGYSFLALKCLSQLAGAIQGVLCFVIARRVLKSDLAAVVALFSLLFSEDFLKATSYFTGINLADALLLGGVALCLYRKPLVGGVLAGAAMMTLLQAAPTVFVLGAATLLADRAAGKRFAIGLSATLAFCHVVGFAYGGGAFLEQVYFYHLHKIATEGAGEKMLGFLYADNVALFAGGTLALGLAFTALDRREEPRRFVRVLAVAVVFQFIAMATRPKVFPFYFQPVFGALAIAIGWAVAVGVDRFRAARTGGERAVGIALALGVALLPTLLTGPITDVVSSTRAEQRRTYVQSYQWKDAPLIGPLNRVVEALFWRGGERAADTWHLGATEYLWNQSRAFDAYPKLVEAVTNNSTSTETIFGDSAAVPLVALGAQRKITADFVDTNAQRFASGTTPASEAIRQLEETGGPALMIASKQAGVFSVPEFADYLQAKYHPIDHFADSNGTPYTLYRRSP